MKRTLSILLILMLLVCAASADVLIDDDVFDVAFDVEEEVRIDTGNGADTASLLKIQYVGSEAVPRESAYELLGLGELSVYAPSKESMLRYVYEGIRGADVGDHEFVNYDSFYRGGEDGSLTGQVKRIYYADDDPFVIYIQFHFNDTLDHNGLRVQWLPEEKIWHISRFDFDTIKTPYEAEIACIFDYLNYSPYTVETKKDKLNVRSAPDGKVLHTLEKGAQITVFNCEINDTNGRPFTLIEKYTEPDDEGVSRLEYRGWVASEYLVHDDDYAWIINERTDDN